MRVDFQPLAHGEQHQRLLERSTTRNCVSESGLDGAQELETSKLLAPLTLRDITLRHRIVVPPMHQYSGVDGYPTDWHLVHLGRLAMGGASMVVVEATAIAADGRVGYGDLGLWKDEHIAPLRRISAFLRSQGSVPGIQIVHAGRKAATQRPWHGLKSLGTEDILRREEPPWPIISVSGEPADAFSATPHALDLCEIPELIALWRDAASRAAQADFDVLELHGAHGYLLHSFLSPLSNHRHDAYGGSLQGRMRLVLEVVEAVREVWPAGRPLFFRVSAVDGPEDGWCIEDTVVLARELKCRGVDVIDCSSGGIGSVSSRIARTPGFQVRFAAHVREEAGIATMAVGLITSTAQAAAIVDDGKADLVAIGRQCLLEPNLPLRFIRELEPERGFSDWPPQAGWWLARRRIN